MPRKLYKLTDGDRAIFARAAKENNPSRITNFYLRSENSGTWWRPISQKQIDGLEIPESREAADRWKAGYENLLEIWKYLGRPSYFGPDPKDYDNWVPIREAQYKEMSGKLDRVYRVQFDLDTAEPAFHHPHGVQFLPWQLDMYRSKHPIQVVIGGFGSSKTWGKLLTMLVRAITLPGYRGFALAPYSIQSEEVYKQALLIIQGTEFERFLIASPRRPYPHLIIGNDLVGENTIECYPVLDDPGKILTLTGDEAMVDQAELIPNLDELIRNVGSRFRGLHKGRERVGQLSLIANSGDSPQLWDWFDEAEDDPDYVWSAQPGTYDNSYLTVSDLMRFERQVGKDVASRNMYLRGHRPLGSGEHFPQSSLMLMKATWLDDLMSDNISKPGYIRESGKRTGVYKWFMPPKDDARYIVVADPGWGNPPERNSAVIGVWDISNFPEVPAIMWGFDWVFGGGSPNPWMQSFMECVSKYRAVGMCGFDSTGFQAGYERMTSLHELLPTPVVMTGNKKYVYLNLTKKMMADGKMQAPTIHHLYSQAAKYKLPDDKLRQDIVSMLFVTAAMLEPYYYQGVADGEDDFYTPGDRWERPEVSTWSDRSYFD
jgi:hypothetical protein